MPSALHLNARTEYDYIRWASLIAQRAEIEILAFEFATGCGRGERIDWHWRSSAPWPVGSSARSPLSSAVVAASCMGWPTFRAGEFDRDGRIREDTASTPGLHDGIWPTEVGEISDAVDAPIDELLAHNIALTRSAYEAKPSPCRSRLATNLSRRASHRDRETIQASLLSELYLTGATRSVAPQPHGVVAAAKP